jgi:hypothetical protein
VKKRERRKKKERETGFAKLIKKTQLLGCGFLQKCYK